MKTNNPKRPSRSNWYTYKGSALALALVSLALTYPLVLRAIDTGSLQQYFVILVLVGFSINRIRFSIFGRRPGAHV
ncbi:MAG: hypothetical protein ACQR33_04290 [Candidatus Saccharibacteria bacterium]